MIYAILAAIVLAIVFLPNMWVKHVMEQHNHDRPDFPGTGSELAKHLLAEAGLDHVTVEVTQDGDHYDPKDKEHPHDLHLDEYEGAMTIEYWLVFQCTTCYLGGISHSFLLVVFCRIR